MAIATPAVLVGQVAAKLRRDDYRNVLMHGDGFDLLRSEIAHGDAIFQ